MRSGFIFSMLVEKNGFHVDYDDVRTTSAEPRTFQKHSARESCITVRKRLALASILGPFGVHLLKFTLDTHPGSLMHYLGLLEFLVRICDALQHTRDVPNLSDEYDCDLITGFPFALVFTCVRLGHAFLTSRST